MIEQLIRQHFELPAFSRFYRIAITARAKINEDCFELINAKLTPSHEKLLDNWISMKTGTSLSWWAQLKKEAPSPTTKNFRLYLKYVDWLKKYYEELPVKTAQLNLPNAKRRQFSLEAFACNWPIDLISRISAQVSIPVSFNF